MVVPLGLVNKSVPYIGGEVELRACWCRTVAIGCPDYGFVYSLGEPNGQEEEICGGVIVG